MRYYEGFDNADRVEVYCTERRTCPYGGEIKVREHKKYITLSVCELNSDILIRTFCPYGYELEMISSFDMEDYFFYISSKQIEE